MCRVTRPARKHLGQLLGYEVRLEAALQLSSVIKKRGSHLPGGRAGHIIAKIVLGINVSLCINLPACFSIRHLPVFGSLCFPIARWSNTDLKPSKGSVKGQRYVGPGRIDGKSSHRTTRWEVTSRAE